VAPTGLLGPALGLELGLAPALGRELLGRLLALHALDRKPALVEDGAVVARRLGRRGVGVVDLALLVHPLVQLSPGGGAGGEQGGQGEAGGEAALHRAKGPAARGVPSSPRV